MDEMEQFSSLIGELYDAAIDASHWSGVLEKSAQFLDAFAVSLWQLDCSNPAASLERHFGVDPYYLQLCKEKYWRCDPRPALSYLFKPGEVFSTAEFPVAEFRDTRFYQEWLKPQGVKENVRCIFERTPQAEFGIFRHEDSPDRIAFCRMKLLMPHMRRAVSIHKTINRGRAETAAFADILDDLHSGIFLLDAKQRIVHANKAGHAMLAAKVFLRTGDGRLSTTEPNGGQALECGIAMASKGNPKASGKGQTMLFGEGYVGHLLPLTAGARRSAGALYEAVAALFVHKTAAEAPSAPEILAMRYGLTPMELNVLLAIVDGGGVPDVAEVLGIARSTVRTHLHRIFAKTETRRQTDLVKLVAGFANPLRG
jgi:DNA-binding CsgD family transcriptional regulator/PAS domain-containing protein